MAEKVSTEGLPPVPVFVPPDTKGDTPAQVIEEYKQGIGDYVVKLGTWLLMVSAMLVATIGGTYLANKLGVSSPPVVVVPPAPQTKVLAKEEAPIYFCGRVEELVDNLNTRPWPLKQLSWNVNTQGYKGGISEIRLQEAFKVAWAAWGAYLDMTVVNTLDPSKAHVVSKFGTIDGGGNVLAWSELSDGTLVPKNQLYDAGEAWEIEANPTQIDLVRVACHEIGHALGLTHDDPGSHALMAPVYDRQVRFPTSRDVSRLLALGYKAKVKDPNDPGPTIPPLNLTIDAKVIMDALDKAGFKVEKK